MSYSFSIRASNKTEAKAKVAAKFEEVIASQPIHEADKGAVNSTASAMIDVVRETSDTLDISVSVNGYVAKAADGSLITASISCQAHLVQAEAQAA